MLGDEDSHHQDGDTTVETGRLVQVDSEPGRREVDPADFHQSFGPHDMYGSCLQMPQTLEGYSAVIYEVCLKSNETDAIKFFIH
jgi:hypothetical protein